MLGRRCLAALEIDDLVRIEQAVASIASRTRVRVALAGWLNRAGVDEWRRLLLALTTSVLRRMCTGLGLPGRAVAKPVLVDRIVAAVEAGQAVRARSDCSEEGHDWRHCVCRRCGARVTARSRAAHAWRAGRCVRCDKTSNCARFGHMFQWPCSCSLCGFVDHGRHRLGGDKACMGCGASWDCKTFGHGWDGCVCKICDARAPFNVLHAWVSYSCRKCGVRWSCVDRDHVFRSCRCEVCGETKGLETGADQRIHRWDGGSCRSCQVTWDCAIRGHWELESRCCCPRCGLRRGVDPVLPDHHRWSGNQCSVCRLWWSCDDLGHRWDDRCWCSVCNRTRRIDPFDRDQHDWECDRCTRCEYACQHEMEGEVCRICGWQLATVRVRIVNSMGAHARACVKFVQVANRFHCKVEVQKDDYVANGKSIMGMATLVAAHGHVLDITVQGPEAAVVAQALADLVGCGFGEGIDP